jgi:hypothetical protein
MLAPNACFILHFALFTLHLLQAAMVLPQAS